MVYSAGLNQSISLVIIAGTVISILLRQTDTDKGKDACLVVVLPRTPCVEMLAHAQLKGMHMTDDCEQREQMFRGTVIHIVRKQPVRLYNIHNLLHTIPVKFVHIVVE